MYLTKTLEGLMKLTLIYILNFCKREMVGKKVHWFHYNNLKHRIWKDIGIGIECVEWSKLVRVE